MRDDIEDVICQKIEVYNKLKSLYNLFIGNIISIDIKTNGRIPLTVSRRGNTDTFSFMECQLVIKFDIDIDHGAQENFSEISLFEIDDKGNVMDPDIIQKIRLDPNGAMQALNDEDSNIFWVHSYDDCKKLFLNMLNAWVMHKYFMFDEIEFDFLNARRG